MTGQPVGTANSTRSPLLGPPRLTTVGAEKPDIEGVAADLKATLYYLQQIFNSLLVANDVQGAVTLFNRVYAAAAKLAAIPATKKLAGIAVGIGVTAVPHGFTAAPGALSIVPTANVLVYQPQAPDKTNVYVQALSATTCDIYLEDPTRTTALEAIVTALQTP